MTKIQEVFVERGVPGAIDYLSDLIEKLKLDVSTVDKQAVESLVARVEKLEGSVKPAPEPLPPVVPAVVGKEDFRG